jgi:hypothetical protein
MSARDLTLRGLVDQFLQALSRIDSRLLRSLRGLVTRPGALTLAFTRGERKNYVGPIQLFFIANALFFATQSLTHMNVRSSSLDSHPHHQDGAPSRSRWCRNVWTRNRRPSRHTPRSSIMPSS